jgi:competence protein ComFC
MKQLLRVKLSQGFNLLVWLHTIVRDIIAPPVCVACKEFVNASVILCAGCAKLIKPVISYALPITKQYAVTVFAVSRYDGIVQHLVRAKQAGKIYAARSLGFLMWDYTDIRFQEFDYIVPVPLHWRRYAARGYNQAEEMGCSLSERSGKPILSCLYRSRATAVQASLSAQERVTNVKDAFVFKNKYSNKVRGARILLVDDVLTTGSTLEACVRALRVERPLSITIIVGSRVV